MSRSLMAFSALLFLLCIAPVCGATTPALPPSANAISSGWEPTATIDLTASPFLLAAGRGVLWAGSYTSTDCGASWVATRHDGIDRQLLDDIGIDPRDPAHVWVIDNVGSILETRDGGTSYQKIVDPRGSGFRYGSVNALATAPSDPNVVFAMKNGFGIFRSTDAGHSWTFLPRSEVDSSNTLAVDPSSADIVYSGYTRKPFQKSAVIRHSSDRGESWRTALEIKDALAVTSIAVDPKTPNNVFAGSTGNEAALWVSRDRGSNFERLARGFDFTNVHKFTASPSEPAVAYAGVWGGGTWRTVDRGHSWTRLTAPTESASAILIDPRNPQVLYLGDRTAPRIWRTSDGGATWSRYFDAGSSFYRVQSAALAPSDPDVMYVSVFARSNVPTSGTLFRIHNGVAAPTASQPLRPCTAIAVDPRDEHVVYAVLHGSGVSKSRDGGATWESLVRLGSGLPTSTTFGYNGISIDPATPDTIDLFGGCDVGFDFFHTGASPADMNAIYRSTNAGTSWAQIGTGSFGSTTGAVKDVVRVPGHPGMLLAQTGAGLRLSTDSGSTWSAPSGDVTVVKPAGVVTSSDGLTIYVPTLGGGVRTGTIGANGSMAWDGSSTLHSPVSHVQVIVDPADSKTLYATAYPGGIYKSTDSGESWSEQNFGMASFEIDDASRHGYYSLAVAPSNPQRLYVALYGIGIYTSVDGAGVWRPCNGALAEMRGKPITSLFVDPANDKKVWVAGEDGVRVTTNAGTTWTEVTTGLATPDIRVIARATDGRVYAGSKGYEAWALDANASTWQQLPALANFGAAWPVWNDRPLYQFTAPLFHSTDSKIVYLATFPTGIFRSDDGGASWRERNIGSASDGLFSLVSRPGQPEVLFAGTYNGINRSADGGEHWKAADSGWPAEQWVYSIDFDPRNPDVMYACSRNGESEGLGREDFKGTVMKSTDGGAKWSAITQGLDLAQAFFEIIVDHRQPETIYLASERAGVLISRDAGASWSAFNDGLTSLQSMTNGNHVSSPMVLSSDGYYLFFAAAQGGVFRRAVASGPPRRRVVPR